MACLHRMLWSFSRDGGIPFHRLWSAINRTSGTPILAVWAMVTFAFLLGLPMLHSTAAFQAVTSISTIGLYISCERFLLPFKSRTFMDSVLSLGMQQPSMGHVMLRYLTSGALANTDSCSLLVQSTAHAIMSGSQRSCPKSGSQGSNHRHAVQMASPSS